VSAELRPFQREIVHAITSGESKIIAAEQGLGKTFCAIAIADWEEAQNILVLTTNSAKLSWRKEIFERSTRKPLVFTPHRASDVAVPLGKDKVVYRLVNYDKLSRSENGFLEALIACGPYDLLILDEAHCVKDLGSIRTKAVYGKGGLIEHAKHTVPMSGTIAPNNAGELWVHIRSLQPEIITNPNGQVMSRMQFEDEYCQVEMKHLGNGRPVRVIKGSKNIGQLRQRMGTFIIRKTKRECLPELPELMFTTVPLEIKDQSSLEKTMPFKEFSDEEFIKAVQADDHIMRQLVNIGNAKAVAAAQYLHDFLVDDHKRKIIVWFTNTAPLDYVYNHLAQFHPARIDGRDDVKARDKAITKFLNDPRCQVFLGNIQAAGEGITLLNEFVQPTDVFFVQSLFSPGRNAQAAARSHRIGQKSAVLARTFVADGVWLDQRIQTIITKKANELAELI